MTQVHIPPMVDHVILNSLLASKFNLGIAKVLSVVRTNPLSLSDVTNGN